MTIPTAPVRAALALALTASCAACASGKELASRLGDTDRSVADAQQALDEVDERVAALERSVERQRLLEKKMRRVGRTLRLLRRRVSDLRTGSAAAAAQASEALATVSRLSRALAVLENRLDYHLRRGHGSR